MAPDREPVSATQPLWLERRGLDRLIGGRDEIDLSPVGPGMRAVSFFLNVLLVAWGLAAGVPLW